MLAVVACSAVSVRFLLFPTHAAWPIEVGVALAAWLLLRGSERPAWQIVLVCVAGVAFGRVGDPSWLPSIARVASFSALSEGAPLTTRAAPPTGTTSSALGLVVGSLLLVFTMLRSATFWLGLGLSVSSAWAILRFGHQPPLKVLAVGSILLGVGLSTLTFWSNLCRPPLDEYLVSAGTPIASVAPPPLGAQPLADGLELTNTFPAGVALRRGDHTSCASGEASRALTVVVRRWRERGWLLLEHGSVRLVVTEESMQCVWPTQAALSFDTRLPLGWLLASVLGLLSACLSLAKRSVGDPQWLLLGGALSTLLPIVLSLPAFM